MKSEYLLYCHFYLLCGLKIADTTGHSLFIYGYMNKKLFFSHKLLTSFPVYKIVREKSEKLLLRNV
jgi:hypothetical protein